ncbi:MAG: exonuclease domain-containing protein [Lachnotalea sp.]
MNFIVLDLEWNQCPDGKEKENKKLPFEIIEIGAVKLDSNYSKVSQFSEFIKPSVYKEIHFKTKEVININMEDLYSGRTFLQVCESFFDWCGQDYIFATWGNMDLTELQRNMRYYNLNHEFEFPLKYYDIQKVFSLYFEGLKIKRTLEYSVEYLNIDIDRKFHKAIFDAEYAGKVLSQIDYKFLEKNYSVDYYNPPKVRQDEIYLKYSGYSKFISMEYSSKEEAMQNREVVSTRCNYCNKNMKRKIKWFSNNAKIYYALCHCEVHGLAKCKIRMKRSETGNYFAIKTINSISEQEAQQLREKRDELRSKRKIKRRIQSR